MSWRSPERSAGTCDRLLWWTGVLGLVLLATRVPGARSQAGSGQLTDPTSCAQLVDTECGIPLLTALRTAGSDVRRVCVAADVMIGCTANAVRSCDPIEAAEATDGVKRQVISVFGPNSVTNCQFTNTSLPVFQDDPCRDGLALCFGVLARVDIPTDSANPSDPNNLPLAPVTACIYHGDFKRCIAAELGSCNADLLSLVDTRANETQVKLNAHPFNCDQRQGEIEFQECVENLQRGFGQAPRDRLCQLYEEGKVCLEGAKAASTGPEQAAIFDRDFASFTAFLLQPPLYCQADNPCIEAFRVCNQTPASGVDNPCSLMAVYDQCLSLSLQQCDPQYRTATTQHSSQLKTALEEEFQCSTTVAPLVSSSKSAVCDQVAATCSQRLAQDSSGGAADTPICQRVDALLACVVEGIAVCEPVSRVELVDALGPLIAAYSNPQSNNCDLKNANDPALQLDACDVAIANCSRRLFQAESTEVENLDSILSICQHYDAYIQCTEKTLGACDDVRLQAVNKYVINATLTFHGLPYFCEERKHYDIVSADDKFTECQNDFYATQSGSLEADVICTALQTFRGCLEDAHQTASPRQVTVFDEVYFSLSQPFQQEPYQCDSGVVSPTATTTTIETMTKPKPTTTTTTTAPQSMSPTPKTSTSQPTTTTPTTTTSRPTTTTPTTTTSQPTKATPTTTTSQPTTTTPKTASATKPTTTTTTEPTTAAPNPPTPRPSTTTTTSPATTTTTSEPTVPITVKTENAGEPVTAPTPRTTMTTLRPSIGAGNGLSPGGSTGLGSAAVSLQLRLGSVVCFVMAVALVL